ncbi:nitrate assimilation regulatory nirA [Fusarium pseudocircinatum]|uniref:Nitrate assimilation regulatory nirA n=1 Tax=Fusarium pseudocircinatum TaxID=56676 RepID=A0A8H5PHE2_9HYPO|nr:nitrate assimilation regulatory nirA [Fusarium pseudocircinatum]
MIPHRTPSISDASSSSAQETSQAGAPRRLLPASRPQPAESSTHYQTAPLARKRAPTALACESCRQKKVKVSVNSKMCIVAAAHQSMKCNGARPICSQCRARRSECVYRATPDTDYRDKYEALLESHPAAVVYRAIQTRPRPEALEIVRRIQAGVDAETLMRQLSSADLLLQVQLEPETRSRYQFIYSPLMPTYLQTDDNPFMKSLIHEWSTRDDVVSIASPAFTDTDLGYRAQYLRPHHAATIVDSRLDEIVPSKWTTVAVSDDTMKELIRAYLLQEYDWFAFFHKDYFLDDMISGSNTFCSSLLVNAILAVGCQCRNYVSEPAEYWNPNSLGYKFLEEARRLWIVEVTHNRSLTTLQAALVLNTIVNMFDMDPLSSAFLVRSIEIAHELGLFEPTTYIMNKKLRDSYDLTAWSLFHWQCTLSCQSMTQPLLKTPPKTPLPDPDRDPGWFGEIWLKYPSSSTLVPLKIGLVFKAKMTFRVVLNEAMLEVGKDSTDSYLRQDGGRKIIEITERLDTWYKSMPEPLSPMKIVSPSQLKIHLHYCYVIVQLYEILAPGGQRQAQNLPVEEEVLQESLSRYRGYFETILRIHYLRHSFEYGNMMLTRFLAMLAFLSLNKIESLTTSTKPGHVVTGSGLDVGDADPKEARATLLMAQKGLSDQGRGYYLPKTLLRDVLGNMTSSDAMILQSFITIPPEGPEKTQERKMYMESHCPPDVLRIANDPAPMISSGSVSWLQGLRGIGALLVYFHHHQLFPRDDVDAITLERSFGYRGRYEPATMPILRLLFSGGHFAVAVFFVASGYALSVTPLRLIHVARYEQLGDMIASSLFRRWLRLFAPVFVTSLVVILAQHGVEALWPGIGLSELSLYGDFVLLLRQLREFSFPFFRRTGPSGYAAPFDHNPHLWTIQVEFIGSLIIYMSLVALSRLKTISRITWMTFMIIYSLYFVDCWYGAMFIAGMLTCDVHLLTSADTFHPECQENGTLRAKYVKWAMVTIGLYLGGVPHVPSTRLLARNPGWALLSSLKPEIMADPKWIYLFWSATLIVGVVQYIPMLKKILCSRVCQELGRISYGLYLIHGPVMWTVGAALYSWTGCCRTGNSGQETRQPILGLEFEFILPHVIILPLTLALARLVADSVDAPSIRLAKWLYEISLRKEPDNSY